MITLIKYLFDRQDIFLYKTSSRRVEFIKNSMFKKMLTARFI